MWLIIPLDKKSKRGLRVCAGDSPRSLPVSDVVKCHLCGCAKRLSWRHANNLRITLDFKCHGQSDLARSKVRLHRKLPRKNTRAKPGKCKGRGAGSNPSDSKMSPRAADIDSLLDMDEVVDGSISSPTTGAERAGEISVHLTTFNCANFVHPLFPIPLPSLAPDLIVLGLQELAPSHITFLNLAVIEDLYLKGLESVAESARKRYGKEYKLVKLVRVGQTALVIWSSLGTRLRRIQTAWAGCGLFGLLPNKGGAAARLTVLMGTAIFNYANVRRRSPARGNIRCSPFSSPRKAFPSS